MPLEQIDDLVDRFSRNLRFIPLHIHKDVDVIPSGRHLCHSVRSTASLGTGQLAFARESRHLVGNRPIIRGNQNSQRTSCLKSGLVGVLD
jgi:hypothetical protein